ncbi:zinc finger and SCAN domain-containing protein 2-like [Megalops cyprinoides]|uniref:zinc finger and SCAN domain-containing protein 2-like n=1 Tax=Megalops cyprinoides TaxID=118141 RepID=UPI0018647A4A|nr:zinc finger and SCAN domain-containing protein 2-like [Megalops cyprinoides]
MSVSAHFQMQLASVMEKLAKTAAAEIIRLVEDYAAMLRWEMSESRNEDEGQSEKREVMESTRLVDGNAARDRTGDASGGARAAERAAFDRWNLHFPGEVSGNQGYSFREAGEPKHEGNAPPQAKRHEFAVLGENGPELLTIKKEGLEETWGNCHQQQEPSISGECSEYLIHEGGSQWYRLREPSDLPHTTPQQQYGPVGDPTVVRETAAESNLYTLGENHKGEKRTSCMYCGRCFPYLSYPKRHLQNHTGERPFSCTQCGRGFTRRSHLIRHQQVHTGEKPFDCTLCGRKFARLSHLERHLSTHV